MLLAGASAGAHEPPTRAAEWDALRQARAAAPPPAPRAGWLERQLLALEKRERPGILEVNLHGLHPRVQTIAAGSELAAGARFWRPDLGRSPFDVHGSAFYSIRRYAYADLQAGLLPHRGRLMPPRSVKDDDVYELGDVRRPAGRVVAYASLRHRHEPETRFFGLGAASARDAETRYLYRETHLEGVAGWQWSPRVITSVRLGRRWPGVREGRGERPPIAAAFDDASAPGLLLQPGYLTLTAHALADARDVPFNPHRGAMLALLASRFDDRDGGGFSFTRLAADGRAYLSLGSPQRVAALRALVSRDRATEGGRVPFYLQETLGGSHVLRAYPSFRFRGEKMLAAQAEYRWEAWPALEMAVFGEAGRAFRATEALALRDLRTAWGLALRLKAHERVLGRAEIAWGDEGTRVQARLGGAF